MSDKSSIEWTATVNPDGSVTPGSTWNPVRGCTKVSPGCSRCYAETFAERWRGVPGHPYEQGFDLRLVPEKLAEPLTWKKPRRVFVNSMSDLFQDGVPDAYIDRVFAVMALAPQHTFQVLTKRAERMRDYMNRPGKVADIAVTVFKMFTTLRESERESLKAVKAWPLPNVWLGVSVENQHFADERIPLLLQTPAAVRFISAEPLLGPVNLKRFMSQPMFHCPRCGIEKLRDHCDKCGTFDNTTTNELRGLDWVIVGGESGPGARAFNIEWARSLVSQCRAAGVACFVKQLGSNATANYYDDAMRETVECVGADWPDPIGWHEHDGQPMLTDRVALRLRKKGGVIDDFPDDLRVREFPHAD